jgi:hypothetical protein
MSSNQNTKKPFCKVCCDAGKPESVYTNHFVRSGPNPNSKVICPTLLSLECRYCSKKGHTVKFCSILEKNKNQANKTLMKESVYQGPVVKKEARPTNAFAILEEDSDEEETNVEETNVEETNVEETNVSNNIDNDFPVLGGVKICVQEIQKMDLSYAKALATETKALATETKALATEVKVPVLLPTVSEVKPKPVVEIATVKTAKKWSWVDCPSSSDEEDEDEDEYEDKLQQVAEDNSAW